MKAERGLPGLNIKREGSRERESGEEKRLNEREAKRKEKKAREWIDEGKGSTHTLG